MRTWYTVLCLLECIVACIHACQWLSTGRLSTDPLPVHVQARSDSAYLTMVAKADKIARIQFPYTRQCRPPGTFYRHEFQVGWQGQPSNICAALITYMCLQDCSLLIILHTTSGSCYIVRKSVLSCIVCCCCSLLLPMSWLVSP